MLTQRLWISFSCRHTQRAMDLEFQNDREELQNLIVNKVIEIHGPSSYHCMEVIMIALCEGTTTLKHVFHLNRIVAKRDGISCIFWWILRQNN